MMQKKVTAWLTERYESFIHNLPLIKRGYSFSALRRILPADVPVVIVTELASAAELTWLIKNRDYVCVIAIDRAWELLDRESVRADFVMGALGAIDKRLSDTAIISNIVSDNNCLSKHSGQIFFYWTENELLSDLCKEAQKASEYPYIFNVVELFIDSKDIYERAIDVAEHMQGTSTILLGMQSERAISIDECDDLQIECHVREFISELLPIMDTQGKRTFDILMHSLGTEAKQMRSVMEEEIALYQRLYMMANEGSVYQEKLNEVVTRLNEVIGKRAQSKLSGYVQKLIDKCKNEVLCGQESVEKAQNEIASLALDGLRMSELMRSTYEFLANAYESIDLNVEEYKEITPICKQRQRILIVSGDSQYQVIDGFVQELKTAFGAMGYEVYIWDASYGRILYGYNIYQCTAGYDYIFLMNGVALEGIIGSDLGYPRFWYEGDRTKVAAIFLDHPQVHKYRMQYIRGNVRAIIDDKYDCAYVSQYMPQVQSLHCVLMGGRIQEQVAFEEKENKIVFFGSKTDLSQLAEKINTSPYKVLIWKLIEELLLEPQYTVQEVVRQTGRRYCSLNGYESIMLYSDILLTVQKYVRAYFREKVISEIAASGLPIDLYGWKSEEMAQYPNVTQKEAVGYEEMLAICRNTRFVLNVQPWAKDAPQERVFNAMLGGSIAVSDECDVLKMEYKDGESILLYRLEEIEKLPAQIRYYMEHTEEAKELAEYGYRITAAAHTSEHYAKELLQVLDGEKRQ